MENYLQVCRTNPPRLVEYYTRCVRMNFPSCLMYLSINMIFLKAASALTTTLHLSICVFKTIMYEKLTIDFSMHMIQIGKFLQTLEHQ